VLALLAHPAQDLQPVHLGQADVEQDHVVTVGAQRFDGLVAHAHPIHLKAGEGQALFHAGAQHDIVFRKQQFHGYVPGFKAGRRKKGGSEPAFWNEAPRSGLRFHHHSRLHFIFDNHRFLMKSAAVAS
jgi:hypothetical protein